MVAARSFCSDFIRGTFGTEHSIKSAAQYPMLFHQITRIKVNQISRFVSFVDDKEGTFIILIDPIEDLQEHSVFAYFGFFTEFGDNES